MPEQPYVILEEEEGLATVTLNRGEKRNPLSTAMMTALIETLEKLGQRREVRAVIVARRGRCFQRGSRSQRDARAQSRNFIGDEFDLCARLMRAVQAIPQPVIARVHGVATAAGCQLVATCDLAVASENASFATPGVKIGLFCSTPMVALIPRDRAQARNGDAAHLASRSMRIRRPSGASSTAWWRIPS